MLSYAQNDSRCQRQFQKAILTKKLDEFALAKSSPLKILDCLQTTYLISLPVVSLIRILAYPLSVWMQARSTNIHFYDVFLGI